MKSERIVWVAYKQDYGFIYGKMGQTTDNFAKARVYNQRNHLSSSLGTKKIESGEIVPVPITMTMDPEVMIILKLGGLPIIQKD